MGFNGSKHSTIDRPPEVKLVIFGETGVGKSTLTLQFVQNVFYEFCDPTIEDSYRKQMILANDQQPILLDILDTAGQKEYEDMRIRAIDQYMQEGKGFAFVYMINSRQSFDAIQKFYSKIQRAKDFEKPKGILIGNKSDLVDKRVISYQEGEQLAEDLSLSFLETSALKRENVDEMFQLLAHHTIFGESINFGKNMKAAKRK